MSMIGNYRRVTLAQLDALKMNPDSVPDFLYSSGSAEDMHLEIDKSWHAIHFLLTGSVWEGALPLRNAVLGGVPLGEQDVGYGPARYLTPAEAQAVAEALKAIPAKDLMARYDADALVDAEIYPQIWDEGEQAREYIQYYYEQLVTFFAQAAAAGDAVLLYIN